MATDDEFDEELEEDEEGEDLEIDDDDEDIELDDDIELDADLTLGDTEFEGDDATPTAKDADDADEEADDDEEVEEDEDLDDDVGDETEESLEVLLGTDHDDETEVAGETRGALNKAAHPIGEGEFTCRSCFLVKRRAQLADPKKLICLDCA